MKDIFAKTVTVTALVVLAVAVGSVPLKDADNIEELRYLGSVDDKSYYVAEYNRTTWLSAFLYCYNNKMLLATVKSIAQREFVLNSTADLSYNDCYWTGGRHILKPKEFDWGVSGEALDSSVIYAVQSDIAEACICLRPFVGDYKGVNCSVQNPILCEKVNSK